MDDRINLKGLAKGYHFECKSCRVRMTGCTCSHCGKPTTILVGHEDLVRIAEDAAKAYADAVKLGPDGYPQDMGAGD